MDVQTTAAQMTSPHGQATAHLAASSRYNGARNITERYWTVTVHPKTRGGQHYAGQRDTYEGAQALAAETLVLADTLVDLDRQAAAASAVLAGKLRSQPAAEVTTTTTDEPPF